MARYLEISDKDERIQAFRKDFAAYDKAWATGDSRFNLVSSHYERLSEVVRGVEAYNFAVAGARSIDLAEQIKEATRLSLEEGMVFDYVTLMIGANDFGVESVTEITPPIQFVGYIESALRQLLGLNPQSAILVVGVPEILDVFERTKNIVVHRLFGISYTCDRLRRSLYGNNPIFNPSDVESYQQIKWIMAEYRRATENLIERLSAEFPMARLRTVQGLKSSLNPKKLVSVDCFHPSEWGQAELAELTWRAGFWPDLGVHFD